MFKEFIKDLQEQRGKSVPTEYRIAVGKIKRYYGDKTPTREDLDKTAEEVGKKDLKLKGEDLKYFIRYVETKINMSLEKGVQI